LFVVEENWNDEESEKISHCHVQEKQIGGLKSQQLVFCDDNLEEDKHRQTFLKYRLTILEDIFSLFHQC
jgi:hypothetical protein